MKQRIDFYVRCILIFAILLTVDFSRASAGELKENTIISEEDFDFKEVQRVIDDSGYRDLSFYEVIKSIMNGKSDNIIGTTIKKKVNDLTIETKVQKKMITSLVLIIILSGIMTNFTSILTKDYSDGLAYLIFYIALMGVLISYFLSAFEIADEVMNTIINFMTALIPTFFLSVGIVNQTGAIGFYKIIVCVIYFVELIFLKVIMPLIKIYIMLVFSNEIGRENALSNSIDLFKKCIVSLNKYLLGIVFGINILQGLVVPDIEIMKNGMVKKLTTALPVVGDGKEYILSLFVNSAMLIKNSIGLGAIIILLIICIFPIIKIAISYIMLRLCCAVMQPVAQSGMVKCIVKISDAIMLLLKSVVTILIMFVITIAIVCYSTNRW
ncbi:MAG: hypothetical protein E7254_04225 [Lachnospiraceae bacterium]|nr:hypothetical protein [Lachnospiraceae bacterium]